MAEIQQTEKELNSKHLKDSSGQKFQPQTQIKSE
jgi:hypothetical protein